MFTFVEAHVDGPVALQALQLLLHAPLAMAVVQWAVLQDLQCHLALFVLQHGAAVSAHQALSHNTETRAALRVLVTHLARP